MSKKEQKIKGNLINEVIDLRLELEKDHEQFLRVLLLGGCMGYEFFSTENLKKELERLKELKKELEISK